MKSFTLGRRIALLMAGLGMGTGVASQAADTNVPPRLEARVPQTDQGIPQLSNEKMAWLQDAKFGMFIHWGLYSGIGRGEWYMENNGVLPEDYRKYAYPDSGDAYFDAAHYDPKAWAQLARDAGMKWMCLTARHHDGFCLFDSPYPNAFTSVQTLHRDLFGEYVKACREAGLKVGVYYSPLSWRYPGYYDVTGTDCKPNKFGYKTEPAHKENARVMKEENYVNVKKLMTGYGKIDQIFWDGGWIAQHGTDADGAYFHEPGKFLDPKNQWPIAKQYQDIDDATGKPLGIMGMVRKYQPDAISNLRYGWMGDILEQEGPQEIKGPILTKEIYDKNLTMQMGGWGYNAGSVAAGRIMTSADIINYLANCTIRNMTLMVNVAPDRHGVIPDLEQKRLREVGDWLKQAGDAVYGTRGGPWQPTDRQFGYSYKNSTVFVHILRQYQGTDFKVPPLGSLKVKRVYDVLTGKPLQFDTGDGISIHGIDRTKSPVDSIVGIEYDADIQSVWN
ncbi:MAG: alpha-L-fucosidase [Tepidisphaeraceae bacterium]